MHYKKAHNGYSIIELLAVIVIVGIITSVALKSLRTVNDTSRAEKTKKELDQLAYAVAGDPNLTSGGTRADFGYVGDVGSMPANLDALVSNPGGYATWNGPYLRDDYLPSSGSSNTEYKVDEWGTNYNYSGNTIASTGGGTTITRKLANSVNDLLYNSVAVAVTDLNQHTPGPVYDDSIRIVLTHPNGTGGSTTKTRTPSQDGFIKIDSVPIGKHTLKVIYLPNNDTLTREITVNPGELSSIDVSLFRAVWATSPGGGGGSSTPTVTIRPNGAGSSSNLNNSGCGSHWQCADDLLPDDDATYVSGGGSGWNFDTYAADNTSTSGTIDSLIVYIRVRSTGSSEQARTVIRTNSTNYNGTNINLNGVSTYTIYSTKYVVNPNSSAAWTWTNINNLQIGVGLDGNPRCTQVWAIVYFTP